MAIIRFETQKPPKNRLKFLYNGIYKVSQKGGKISV